MRFISEFELKYANAIHSNVLKSYKANGQFDLGNKISEHFDWKDNKKGALHKFTLEIEAFPMDKWIEFKGKLLEHFCVYPGSTQKMLSFIKELDSFGKPSGDAITNQ